MKKALVTVGVLAVLVGLAKRFAPRMDTIDWQRKFDAMPDNAPPKWMFRNISEIHANTEHIIELLEDRLGEGEPRESATTSAP